jgi:hypothetical protein
MSEIKEAPKDIKDPYLVSIIHILTTPIIAKRTSNITINHNYW